MDEVDRALCCRPAPFLDHCDGIGATRAVAGRFGCDGPRANPQDRKEQMFLRSVVRSIGALALTAGILVSLPASADAATRQTPQLSISKNHGAPFFRGQTGQYSVFVQNIGDAATLGTVEVDEVPPTGLTVTAMAGDGWTCTVASLSCTRSDSLSGGASYPAITVTVAVAENAPDSVVNVVRVSGGGSVPAEAEDPTNVVTPAQPAQLSINKTHSGDFTQGGTGTYTIDVSNAANAGPTSGTVTVTDTLPAGVTPTAASGTGWNCSVSGQTVTCTRTDALAAGSSYPTITVTANVTTSAPCAFSNTATVSGGGSASASDNDPTTVTGGTCNGGNGGNGGGSLLPINLNGVLTMFNNISTSNNINSPGASNITNQNFTNKAG
ncbi:hypothetical protein [Streptomyces litmocidini]|uniref:DUF11 domain-containing protein n=1 Tax=Streptomyces litmocidini TaxID=67318 RepID=A0ABW7UI80_9ACTN